MNELYYAITRDRGFFNEIDAAVFVRYVHDGDTHYAPLFVLLHAFNIGSTRLDTRCLLFKETTNAQRVKSRLIAGDPLTDFDTDYLYSLSEPLLDRKQGYDNMKLMTDPMQAFDEMFTAAFSRMPDMKKSNFYPLYEFFRDSVRPYMKNLPTPFNPIPITSL